MNKILAWKLNSFANFDKRFCDDMVKLLGFLF